MWDLTGKVALVTGGSSGFGAHFAATLCNANATVVLAARRMNELQRVAESIRQLRRGRVESLELDVTSPDSISRALGRIEGVDILINNAGVVRSASALEQTSADWDTVMDTNLKGAFLVAQAVARHLKSAGRPGSIINIASILGMRQASTVLPYAVSKAGIIQMTKVLALEFARFHIRVNALAPGYFDTELNREFLQTPAGLALTQRIPQRRVGQLTDLDGPLLLLASDASRYMTGAVLPVDGGHLVSGL
jgi:NAD(P)-dependent dehydrogenase (short-subunit alcohol dehydrogenase family)